MKMNIAVTSSGSAPAVAVIKALRKQGEIAVHITALDMDPKSSGNYMADRGLVVPAPTESGFIDKILNICRSYDIQCLIPIIDEELLVFSDNRSVFEKSGVKLIVNNKQAIRLAKDKSKTSQFCARENIITPETFLKNGIDKIKKRGFPFIIKPLSGRGSKDTAVIKNSKELAFFKNYFKDYIIQEFIKGDEYTIDIVASSCGDILQAVPRQRIAVKAGMSYKGKTLKDPRLIAYGKDIAKKFGINGPANIQCIVNNKNTYLIEVNPKFAAGLPLTVAAGVNIPLVLVKLAFSLDVREEELEFEDGLYMLRFWEEIFVR